MWRVVRIPVDDITNFHYNFVVAKPLVLIKAPHTNKLKLGTIVFKAIHSGLHLAYNPPPPNKSELFLKGWGIFIIMWRRALVLLDASFICQLLHQFVLSIYHKNLVYWKQIDNLDYFSWRIALQMLSESKLGRAAIMQP